ncbi:hypothetical protein WJX84_010552, partial [Apatococcus fuscideae]
MPIGEPLVSGVAASVAERKSAGNQRPLQRGLAPAGWSAERKRHLNERKRSALLEASAEGASAKRRRTTSQGRQSGLQASGRSPSPKDGLPGPSHASGSLPAAQNGKLPQASASNPSKAASKVSPRKADSRARAVKQHIRSKAAEAPAPAPKQPQLQENGTVPSGTPSGAYAAPAAANGPVTPEIGQGGPYEDQGGRQSMHPPSSSLAGLEPSGDIRGSGARKTKAGKQSKGPTNRRASKGKQGGPAGASHPQMQIPAPGPSDASLLQGGDSLQPGPMSETTQLDPEAATASAPWQQQKTENPVKKQSKRAGKVSQPHAQGTVADAATPSSLNFAHQPSPRPGLVIKPRTLAHSQQNQLAASAGGIRDPVPRSKLANSIGSGLRPGPEGNSAYMPAAESPLQAASTPRAGPASIAPSNSNPSAEGRAGALAAPGPSVGAPSTNKLEDQGPSSAMAPAAGILSNAQQAQPGGGGLLGDLVDGQDVGEDDGSLGWLLRHSLVMRREAGWAFDKEMQLRPMLKLGCLAMQPVHVCTRSTGAPLLNGTITPEGSISCECSRCKGGLVSASEFEDHSGCKDHRPGNTIRLRRHELTLKDFLDKLNHMAALEGARCRICSKSDGLLECSCCGSFQHPGCISLQEAPQPDWSVDTRITELVYGGVVAEARRLAAGGAAGARTAFMAPTTPGLQREEKRKARNSSKHKVLFTPEAGALQEGEKVTYRDTRGIALLEGQACLDPRGPGIRCSHCNEVISPSSFEAHAGFGARRAPYNFIHNSKGISLADIAKGLVDRELAEEPENSLSICALCKGPDFQEGAFGPNTVLICDQCDREFHVKCLKERGICDLSEVPKGEWFCSEACTSISAGLQAALEAGEVDVGAGSSWQLLHGLKGRPDDGDALETARTILQTSFDPIIDRVSGKDLLEAMVFAREVGDWDFHGMHTAILYHEDAPGNEATPSGNDGQLGDGATHRLPALPDKAAYMEMKAQPPLPGSGPLANSSPATSAFNSPGVGLPVGAASPPAASPAVLLQAPSAPQGAAPIKGLPHSDQSAASTA